MDILHLSRRLVVRVNYIELLCEDARYSFQLFVRFLYHVFFFRQKKKLLNDAYYT